MSFLRFERVLRMALKNISEYKMRAALTVLGLVFGVCSVVSMLAVGEGASQEVQEQIRQLGSDNILIKSVKPVQSQSTGGQTQNQRVAMYGITYKDQQDFSRFVPNLVSTTPLKRLSYSVQFREKQIETDIVATVPWYPQVTNQRILTGRFFTNEDMQSAAAVCVIGSRLARTIFASYDPIGKFLRVGDKDVYRIIGVIGDVFNRENLTNKPLWFEGDNQEVYLPLESYKKRNGDMFVKFGSGEGTMEKVELHEIILKMQSQDHVMQASRAVRNLLARNHARTDYEIVVPLQLLEQARETRRLFNIVLGSIAAISLIVGGIGIMNIMLATVSERTREIGIRRALGAHRRDIVIQFLIETTVLSVIGGLVGMVLGAIIPAIVTATTDVKTVLMPSAFLIAFTVSVAVGIIFGIYPARRAAMMDPIEALRHE